MKVRDLMTTEVVSVSESTSLKEAAQLMASHGVSGLPVVSEGKVVGVVSEADFVERSSTRSRASLVELLFSRGERRREADTVGEVMTRDVVTIGPDTNHADAARLMRRKRVKRLPVVDDDGRLIGIVSRADILGVFTRPDVDIEREIRERLIGQVLAIEPDRVTVTVEDGRVRLEGTLQAKTESQLLEELASRVDGVLGVDANLRYLVDDTKPAEDTWVAGAPRPNW